MSRYIDADALIEKLQDKNAMLTYAVFIIKEQPPADVREVVRGEWKETTESIGWEEVSCAECSVCGETFVLGDYAMDDIKLGFNYCPNCGADMRGEEDG